jgi:hypothetical protein
LKAGIDFSIAVFPKSSIFSSTVKEHSLPIFMDQLQMYAAHFALTNCISATISFFTDLTNFSPLFTPSKNTFANFERDRMGIFKTFPNNF